MNKAQRNLRRGAISLSLLACACVAAAQEHAKTAPYAGQQERDIKSLSAQDVSALLAGQGMGLAKAAELNGYPGPAHVLELSEPLGLTPQQQAATQALMAAHKARAVQLGAALVEAERQLDTLFRTRSADASALDAATDRVGAAQARLRAEHLQTHLAQTALLSQHQIHQYNRLRGYEVVDAGPQPAPAAHPAHHHN